jgi:hypothetical protein
MTCSTLSIFKLIYEEDQANPHDSSEKNWDDMYWDKWGNCDELIYATGVPPDDPHFASSKLALVSAMAVCQH